MSVGRALIADRMTTTEKIVVGSFPLILRDKVALEIKHGLISKAYRHLVNERASQLDL